MKTLKQKIEEAAENYEDKEILSNPFHSDLYKAFNCGAQFILDEGVRYSKEDMSNAFNAGIRWNYNPDEFPDFEEWVKERGNE